MKFWGVLLWSVGACCVAVVVCGLMLIGAGLRFGVVQSSSMVPTLRVGEVICWAKTGNFQCGDIVIFDDDNKRVAHRVVRLDGDNFAVKGDSPSSEIAVISASQVRGKLVFSFSIENLICICVAITFIILVFGKFLTRKRGAHFIY